MHLDGFIFELPGEEYGCDIFKLAEGVRCVLKHLSDNDPAKVHCMSKSYIASIGWSFEFNREPIFVTTFAPCYPSSHSRYAFGADNAFILMQPMYSFAIHDMGEDTPHTNWDNPQTARDKLLKTMVDRITFETRYGTLWCMILLSLLWKDLHMDISY